MAEMQVMQRRSQAVGILFAIILALAPHLASAGQTVTLKSGRTVEILGAGKVQFSNDAPSLMLRYETSLPSDDAAALRLEADEIWDRFIHDVERAGLTGGILHALPKSIAKVIVSDVAFNFFYVKRGDSWRTFESKDRTELDETFVRSFLDRLDRIHDAKNLNAFFVYVADAWAISLTGPPDYIPVPVQITRAQYAAQLRQSPVPAINRTREIMRIEIAADRQSARIQSQESEIVERDGQKRRMISESSDTIELRNQMMLLKSSTARLVKVE
jgi:hypothetical protein